MRTAKLFTRRFLSLTKREIEFLSLHRNNPTLISTELKVCTDTAKRWLVKLKLRRQEDFPAGKYQVAKHGRVVMWNRPCSGCGSKTNRPKFKFYCHNCTEARGFAHASPLYYI